MSGKPSYQTKAYSNVAKPWRLFYILKPTIPRLLQLWIRRMIVKQRLKTFRHLWPIDPNAATPPQGWPGWPDGRQFAIILSHDVDTQKGHDACPRLAAIEKKLGFRSAFNFVPERYQNSASLRNSLREDGFEIGIHGLKHDGKLFRSYRIFKKRAVRINRYMADWEVEGFTSPSMHHNLSWMHHLAIKHCTTTFDTDPFEPQPDGVGTIFPFWIAHHGENRGFVELPYTLPQDFTLFVLMRERGIDIWKKKLDWIAAHGGMVLVNTHPDYMNFENAPAGSEEYPVKFYIDFLEYIQDRYADRYFHAIPSQVTKVVAPILRSRPGALNRTVASLN